MSRRARGAPTHRAGRERIATCASDGRVTSASPSTAGSAQCPLPETASRVIEHARPARSSRTSQLRAARVKRQASRIPIPYLQMTTTIATDFSGHPPRPLGLMTGAGRLSGPSGHTAHSPRARVHILLHVIWSFEAKEAAATRCMGTASASP